MKVQLQNRTHEKLIVEITPPDAPFSIRKNKLEMKELDQSYFFDEQEKNKRKYAFFDSISHKTKVSKVSCRYIDNYLTFRQHIRFQESDSSDSD